MTRDDLISLIQDMVRAGAGQVTVAQYQTALGLAVERYSMDKPRLVTEDVHADGGQTLPLPAGWAEQSELRGLESPVGNFPPAMWESSSYGLLEAPEGTVIGLADLVNAGERMRVHYTLPHEVSAARCTPPARDREAICCWAAAALCDQVAGTFASNTGSTITADSVDSNNPAREWRARGRDFRARYAALLGVVGVTGGAADKPISQPAGVSVAMPMTDSRRQGWVNRYR